MSQNEERLIELFIKSLQEKPGNSGAWFREEVIKLISPKGFVTLMRKLGGGKQ